MELVDLIESVDIVEYISQYVDLEERSGEYWGLSPFKDENTPSFSVRRETNSFYDFSSGIGGNVFTFIRYYHNCTKQEAVNILKSYVGIDGSSFTPASKMSCVKICRKFKPQKRNKKGAKGSVYPDDCMEKYEKREDKLSEWEKEGISKESLTKYQVFYDGFSNRLVYPIRNLSGQIVNIGGRTLDKQWKEKGLRKYTYFSGWGEMNIIYGLFENMEAVLEAGEIILFEGCKSVLIADTWGFHNTGALLTSHLNPQQLKILAKLGVRVVFALDKDVRIADDHNIAKLKQYTNVFYIWDYRDFLDNKDSPVDKGKEVFKELYEHRLRF